MPDTDTSHTASGGSRKEELAALFVEWDRPGASAPSRRRVERQGIWLRAAVTLACLGIAALVMWATRASFSYWMEPGAPRDLGSLRERWLAGASSAASPIGPDNGHVAMRELVPTRLLAVSTEVDPTPDEVRYLFFCPLYDVVVMTPSAPAIDPGRAPDPSLDRLVKEQLAAPAETAASVDVQGRLVRADAAPAELAPFIESFARRVEKRPADLWVLLDGARPADETWTAALWALAAASPLLALVFLLRALRALRRSDPPAEVPR